MKKLSLLFVVIALVLAACQEVPEPVDLKAEKETISEMFNSVEELMKIPDVDTLLSFYSEDLLVCGTDPSEFWNKEEIKAMWKEMAGGVLPEMDFFGDRVIKVAPDGKSAIVVEQLNISYTPGIAWRNVYSLSKTEGKWLVTFWSSGLIPENKDLATIAKSVAVEEPVVE